MIAFTCPCVPQPQPRQRHRVVEAHGKAFATNYTPRDGKVQTFKQQVRLAARLAHRGEPLTGPLSVGMLFLMPRPKAKRWKTKPMPREWHTGPIDWDNLGKSVCDALKGITWVDDGQIAVAEIHKRIAAGDEQPGVTVRIQRLEQA